MDSCSEGNIDFVLLSNLLEGDTKNIIECAQRFVNSTEEDIDAIESAWGRNDIDEMKFWVHRSKERAGLVGALKLVRLCQQLEISLLVEDRSGVKRMVGAIRILVEQIKVDVAQYRAACNARLIQS